MAEKNFSELFVEDPEMKALHDDGNDSAIGKFQKSMARQFFKMTKADFDNIINNCVAQFAYCGFNPELMLEKMMEAAIERGEADRFDSDLTFLITLFHTHGPHIQNIRDRSNPQQAALHRMIETYKIKNNAESNTSVTLSRISAALAYKSWKVCEIVNNANFVVSPAEFGCQLKIQHVGNFVPGLLDLTDGLNAAIARRYIIYVIYQAHSMVKTAKAKNTKSSQNFAKALALISKFADAANKGSIESKEHKDEFASANFAIDEADFVSAVTVCVTKYRSAGGIEEAGDKKATVNGLELIFSSTEEPREVAKKVWTFAANAE